MAPLISRIGLSLLAAAMKYVNSQLTFSVNTSVALHKMASPYLSFNIDMGSVYNGFDWSDPVLINLVYALNPLNSGGGVYIRVGGTAADYSYYQPDSTNPAGGNGHTIIGDSTLEAIWQFAGQAHATILWDFNGLSFRNQTSFGPWDPTGNATAILAYLNSTHPKVTNWAWSLGNEPDLWPTKTKNWTQLGLDAHTLSSTLRDYTVGDTVYGPSFAGLDNLTAIEEYLRAANGALTGLTVHSYPVGHPCDVSNYLNTTYHVGRMARDLTAIASIKANVSRGVELVLEETAGSAGGGCENITDRFVAGFYWINALGATASSQFDRIHRQDIAGWSFTGGESNYQLAGPPGWTNGSALLTPHPDWYTSVLFKTMVGDSVLNGSVTGDPTLAASVTLTAWCSGSPWWFNNSAVISYTNPTGADVAVTLQAVNITAVPRTEYLMTSDAATYSDSRARVATGQPRTLADPMDPPSSLTDDVVYLNGQLWTVDSNGILPALPVVGNTITDPSQGIVLPPYSYGFLQFPGDATHACK